MSGADSSRYGEWLLPGRTKKLKLALTIAGLVAGRGGVGTVLSQSSQVLKQSPELAQLTERVRGQLAEAGKGAVLAIATRQVEALTDRMGQRIESLGRAGGPVGRPDEPEHEPPDDPRDEAPDGSQDEAAGAEPAASRRRVPAQRTTRTSRRPAASGERAEGAVGERAGARTGGRPARRDSSSGTKEQRR